MIYFLPLEDKKQFGRMPVYDRDKKIKYFLLGNMSQVSGTVFLTDLNRTELGSITLEADNLRFSYLIKLKDFADITVRSAGTLNHPIFYISRVKYVMSGSVRKNNFVIRHALQKTATISTTITHYGPTLKISMANQANEEVILLMAALLTQHDLSTIKIKQPNNTTALQTGF